MESDQMQADGGAPRRCTAITLAGTPCRARPLRGRDLCAAHAAQAGDPEVAERLADGRRRGGLNASNAARAARTLVAAGEDFVLEDLSDLLLGTALAVAAGDLSPGTGVAVASVARASLSAREHLELATRIAQIESILIGIDRAEGRRR